MKTIIKRSLRNLTERSLLALSAAPSLVGVRITPGKAGFFGEVFCVLNGLRFAEQHGLSAVITWGQRSLYFDQDYAKDGDAWRSFFDISFFDFRTPPNTQPPLFWLRFKPGAQDFTPYKGLNIRRSLNRALRAWCQPKPDIAAEVDAEWARVSRGRQMLGVHIRLTDAAAGAEMRTTVALENFFVAADDWLKHHPDAGIFLATDETKVVSSFVGRYGAKVTYQDCLRSEDGNSIHGHFDSGVLGSPYQKGRQVLIDALLLARCDHLLRTHSRVTAFSLCWSPGLTYRDLELELTGVNRTPWLHE